MILLIIRKLILTSPILLMQWHLNRLSFWGIPWMFNLGIGSNRFVGQAPRARYLTGNLFLCGDVTGQRFDFAGRI